MKGIYWTKSHGWIAELNDGTWYFVKPCHCSYENCKGFIIDLSKAFQSVDTLQPFVRSMQWLISF